MGARVKSGVLATTALSALLLAACGGGDAEQTPQAGESTATNAPASPSVPAGSTDEPPTAGGTPWAWTSLPVSVEVVIDGWSYRVRLESLPQFTFETSIADSPPGEAQLEATVTSAPVVSIEGLDEGRNSPAVYVPFINYYWPRISTPENEGSYDGLAALEGGLFSCQFLTSGYVPEELSGRGPISRCSIRATEGPGNVPSPSVGVPAATGDLSEGTALELKGTLVMDSVAFVQVQLRSLEAGTPMCQFIVDVATGSVTSSTQGNAGNGECATNGT